MRDGSLWYRFCRWVVTNLFLRPMGGLTVVGAENVPVDGPCLVAPVHLSHLDPPVVGCSCSRAISFMAKEELFRNPLFARLIRSLGAFPVNRGGNDTAAIRLAIDILKEGRTLLVFPEGTRGNGQSMGEIKSGIAMLAKRSGAPVVPVGIAGTHTMLAKKGGLQRSHLTVVFGEPLIWSDFEAGTDPKGCFTAELIRRLHRAQSDAGLALAPSKVSENPEGTTRP